MQTTLKICPNPPINLNFQWKPNKTHFLSSPLAPHKPFLKPFSLCISLKNPVQEDFVNEWNFGEEPTTLPVAIRSPGGVFSRYLWDGGELKLVCVDGNSENLFWEGGYRRLFRVCGCGVRNFFLPREISGSYLEYVKWKFIHRVFSSALQVLATQAMFRAIGIGYSRSLPSAAALNWVLKDGLGRLSRCIYTASLASAFDTNLKRVRFSTSVLFTLSIGVELLTPAFPQYFLLLATVANIAKQISLACYLATGTAVHRSFAVADNLGEVSPTLGGTRIKTRKRNIAAPLDPATFADAVVQIYLDNAGDLELIAKSFESSQLNFSRYGDTFFEVIFTGGRTQPGTTKPDEGDRHPYSIIDCDPTREAILPSVIYIQKILRRRPFLIKNLENVMQRFLQSLELFEENESKKLAIFTALAFSQKLSGLPPEQVFHPLLKDNLVAKGLVLSFITDFFREYLVDNSLDDLISILKRGKIEENLLDFFPPAKRSADAVSEHFTNAGLVVLVEYNVKKIFEVKQKEMKSALTAQIAEETDISEVIETVKQHIRDAKIPDIEVVRILWDVLMDAVQWSGKNQQQNANSALRQVKTWAQLLNTFCTNAKLELELMYKVQIQCYEDAKLMKLFPEIVRSLYDQDVLAEDTILHWFRKGTNSKGRQNFVKALEPFVKWLEEAEEEE